MVAADRSPGVTGRRLTSPRAWALLGLAGELVVLIAVTAWAFPAMWEVSDAVLDEDQSAGPELGVTLSEVADHPDPFWGETVSVSARVDQLIGPHAMLIGNEAPIVGDLVLVVSGPPLAVLLGLEDEPVLSEGEVVRVTGVVRRYEPEELAGDLAIDLPTAALADYDRSSAMVATAITRDLPPPTGGDPEFGGSDGPDVGITPRDIYLHPDRYIGRTVALSGEVEGIYGPYAAWLRDAGVLVVRRRPEPTWFDEAGAHVTGTVRRFDLAALEAELGIDLNEELLAGFAGDPVVVADEIEILK